MENKRILIAFFSREGRNYVNGKIVDLPVGNTEIAAHIIHELTKGDLFKIEALKEYPDDYNEAIKIAKEELKENTRPQLKNHLQNLDSYDVVFLGYPNWWGTMPMPVFTFLEECDLSGKTIIPFCTHEGSGLGRSEKDIKMLCNNANVLKGLAIYGSKVKTSREEIINWLKDIGFII